MRKLSRSCYHADYINRKQDEKVGIHFSYTSAGIGSSLFTETGNAEIYTDYSISSYQCVVQFCKGKTINTRTNKLDSLVILTLLPVAAVLEYLYLYLPS